MGIEPTEPAFRQIPLDLKSRPATRPDSPPRRPHCSRSAAPRGLHLIKSGCGATRSRAPAGTLSAFLDNLELHQSRQVADGPYSVPVEDYPMQAPLVSLQQLASVGDFRGDLGATAAV
jgi:hypothetical protein